jgi:hypothetical protein
VTWRCEGRQATPLIQSMIPKVCTGFRKRSCSTNKLEWDDDSKKSHPALAQFSLSARRSGWRILSSTARTIRLPMAPLPSVWPAT